MTTIDDPSDDRLDDYRDLRAPNGKRQREASRAVLIAEGILAVRRLFTSSHQVRSVLVTPERRSALGEVPPGIPVMIAERDTIAAVCGFDVHRGVLAAADRKAESLVDDVLAANRVVLCEGVNDNENLGSIFRTAAALGIGGLLLDDRCADPLYRRTIRVSLGWSLCLPWARIGSLPDQLQGLTRFGHRTVALTPHPDALKVDEAAASGVLDGQLALMIGAEGPGLSAGSLSAANYRVRIPMSGGVDSLNVATSLGVVGAFAAARAGWE